MVMFSAAPQCEFAQRRFVFALLWHALPPVLFVAGRSIGSEPDRHATVLIHLDAWNSAVDPRGLLVGRKKRTSLVVIDREGPEVLRGDESRQGHFVSPTALQVT